MWSEEFQEHLDHERLSTEIMLASATQWWGSNLALLTALKAYQAEWGRSLRVQAALQHPGWIPWGQISESTPLDGVWQCVCAEGKQHTLQNVIQGTHRLYREWEVTPGLGVTSHSMPQPEHNFILAVQEGPSIEDWPHTLDLDQVLEQLRQKLLRHLGYSHKPAIEQLLKSRSLIGRELVALESGKRYNAGWVRAVHGRQIHTNVGEIWECTPNGPAGELQLKESPPGCTYAVPAFDVVLAGTCAWLATR